MGWFDTLIFAFQRNRRKYVLNILVVVLIGMTALFGGGAAVVLAAQDSMPDEALYPVKTLSEDARLSFTASDQMQLDLILDYTDRRISEILTLSAS